MEVSKTPVNGSKVSQTKVNPKEVSPMAIDPTKVIPTSVSPTVVSQTKVEETDDDETDVDETPLSLKVVFESPAPAVQQSKERKNGPRKVFECSFQGKSYWVLALNRFRALGSIAAHLGGSSKKYEETKVESIEGVLKGLSDEDLKNLLKKIGR